MIKYEYLSTFLDKSVMSFKNNNILKIKDDVDLKSGSLYFSH